MYHTSILEKNTTAKQKEEEVSGDGHWQWNEHSELVMYVRVKWAVVCEITYNEMIVYVRRYCRGAWRTEKGKKDWFVQVFSNDGSLDSYMITVMNSSFHGQHLLSPTSIVVVFPLGGFCSRVVYFAFVADKKTIKESWLCGEQQYVISLAVTLADSQSRHDLSVRACYSRQVEEKEKRTLFNAGYN